MQQKMKRSMTDKGFIRNWQRTITGMKRRSLLSQSKVDMALAYGNAIRTIETETRDI